MSKSPGILRHHFLAQILTYIFFSIVERQRVEEDVKSHKAEAHHSMKDVICICLFVRQQAKQALIYLLSEVDPNTVMSLPSWAGECLARLILLLSAP